MKSKPAYLILALALISAPLFSGTASADGRRDEGRYSHWEQRGHDDRGHHDRGRHDYGRDHHRHHKSRYGRGYWEPEVVYRDRPARYLPGGDGLTIIYSGRWR